MLSYIAASFVALLSRSLELLIISKGKDIKSDKYRNAMSFAITMVAVSVLYFFMDNTYAFENLAVAEKYFLVEAAITELLVILSSVA